MRKAPALTEIKSLNGIPVAPATPLALKQAREAARGHWSHPNSQQIKDKVRVRDKSVRLADVTADEMLLRLSLKEKCEECGCSPVAFKDLVAAYQAGARFGVGELLEITIESRQVYERLWIVLAPFIPPEVFDRAAEAAQEAFENMLPNIEEDEPSRSSDAEQDGEE